MKNLKLILLSATILTASMFSISAHAVTETAGTGGDGTTETTNPGIDIKQRDKQFKGVMGYEPEVVKERVIKKYEYLLKQQRAAGGKDNIQDETAPDNTGVADETTPTDDTGGVGGISADGSQTSSESRDDTISGGSSEVVIPDSSVSPDGADAGISSEINVPKSKSNQAIKDKVKSGGLTPEQMKKARERMGKY